MRVSKDDADLAWLARIVREAQDDEFVGEIRVRFGNRGKIEQVRVDRSLLPPDNGSDSKGRKD